MPVTISEITLTPYDPPLEEQFKLLSTIFTIMYGVNIELLITQPLDLQPSTHYQPILPKKRIPKKTRLEVWKRDGPYCQVCGLKIPKKCYHCGHIVDQFVGGSNDLDNLVVMDEYCNQRKPFHNTRQSYEDWLKSGYWVTDWIKDLRSESGIDRLPPDIISELVSDFDGSPYEQITHYLKQSIRYRQMQQLGLIYEVPHVSKWVERWNTSECPTWKEH